MKKLEGFFFWCEISVYSPTERVIISVYTFTDFLDSLDIHLIFWPSLLIFKYLCQGFNIYHAYSTKAFIEKHSLRGPGKNVK